MTTPNVLRPSRVLAKIRRGEPVLCVKLNLTDSKVADLAGRCGFDCIWTCFEHVPCTVEQVEHQINAAKMHNVDTAVRIQRGCYSDVVVPLEMDAAGIIVPHCMSADDARQIVRQARFHPQGMRACDSGNADGAFCMVPFAEYAGFVNRERFIIVQIEDVEALEQIEDIAAVDGVDGLFFGPGDFSQSLGVPGQYGDPRIVAARKQVAEVANRHGKFAATTSSMDTMQEYLDMGYKFINVGADVLALTAAFSKTVEKFTGLRRPAARGVYSS